MISPLSLTQIARHSAGTCWGADTSFSRFAIDSRKVLPGDLFVAIPGHKADGHQFCDAAVAAGAAGLLVERSVDRLDVPGIRVPNTVTALGVIGSLARSAYRGKVIGITGSAGKTTAKNLLAAVLAELGPVVSTHGNFNNEIGVPLTLQRLAADTQFAVVEMGAGKPNDIAYLRRMVRPNVAVLLNVGTAHLKSYRDHNQLLDTKCQIFDGLTNGDLAVVNGDEAWSDGAISRASPAKCVRFGVKADNDYRATEICQRGFEGCSFTLVADRKSYRFSTAITGVSGIYNALVAATVGLELGASEGAIQRGLDQVFPAKGRGRICRGRSGATIIDDTYNANPEAVRAAIDTLCQADCPRVLILGAMAELGAHSCQLHASVAEHASKRGVDELITVGPDAIAAEQAFAGATRHFADLESMLQALPEFSADTTVLVKGSRSIGLERIVDALADSQEERQC